MKRKSLFLDYLAYILFFLSPSLYFSLFRYLHLDIRPQHRQQQRSWTAGGSRRLHCVTCAQGLLEIHSSDLSFLSLFAFWVLGISRAHPRAKLGSSRCSNVRMTTDAAKWNYKVSLHYVGVLCFFSEIVVTGISMRDLCSLSFSLSFSISYFRWLPFAVGCHRVDTFTVSSPGLLGKGSVRRLSFG